MVADIAAGLSKLVGRGKPAAAAETVTAEAEAEPVWEWAGLDGPLTRREQERLDEALGVKVGG